MLPIDYIEKDKIKKLAKQINLEYDQEKIYYLITLLNKQNLLKEIKDEVAQGGYSTSATKCPYCGYSL